MLGPDTGHSSASAWVRTRNAALFVKPRLFGPYCEEAKVNGILSHLLFTC